MVSNVTLREVAAEAGVSAQAVSLVMNGKSEGQLSRRTCEQVLRAVEKLGYCRNASAGALRGADTKAAAMLTSQRLADIIDEHLINIIMQVTSRLNADGYACFFTELNVQDAGNLQKVRDLLSRGVRRFVVLGHIRNDLEILDLIRNSRAECFHYFNNLGPGIRFSFRQAFRSLWDVLTPEQRSGFRFILHQNEVRACLARIDGLKALPGKTSDHIFDYPLHTHNGPDSRLDMARQGYTALTALLKRHPDCRSVFFYNDHFLTGALQYCVENGLMPGKDLTLGCVNWSGEVAMSPFPLLSIRHPVEEIVACIGSWLNKPENTERCLDMELFRNHAAVRARLYEGIPS